MIRDLAVPGDLLFYRVTPSSSFNSRIIAILELLRGEGEGPIQYSHVAILDEDIDTRIEAVWPKVRSSKVDWNDPRLELWRRPMEASQAAVVTRVAWEHIGDWYDLWGMVFGWRESSHSEYCTTLVVKVFDRIGVRLGVEAGKILTPNELLEDSTIQFVGQVSDALR